jgi:hypothetical protein
MPPELEQTLAMLASRRSVLGYLLLSRGQPVSIIRHVGGAFEGEQGRRYARAVSRIVEAVREGLEDVAADRGDVVCSIVIALCSPCWLISFDAGPSKVHEDTHKKT